MGWQFRAGCEAWACEGRYQRERQGPGLATGVFQAGGIVGEPWRQLAKWRRCGRRWLSSPCAPSQTPRGQHRRFRDSVRAALCDQMQKAIHLGAWLATCADVCRPAQTWAVVSSRGQAGGRGARQVLPPSAKLRTSRFTRPSGGQALRLADRSTPPGQAATRRRSTTRAGTPLCSLSQESPPSETVLAAVMHHALVTRVLARSIPASVNHTVCRYISPTPLTEPPTYPHNQINQIPSPWLFLPHESFHPPPPRPSRPGAHPAFVLITATSATLWPACSGWIVLWAPSSAVCGRSSGTTDTTDRACVLHPASALTVLPPP